MVVYSIWLNISPTDTYLNIAYKTGKYSWNLLEGNEGFYVLSNI